MKPTANTYTEEQLAAMPAYDRELVRKAIEKREMRRRKRETAISRGVSAIAHEMLDMKDRPK